MSTGYFLKSLLPLKVLSQDGATRGCRANARQPLGVYLPTAASPFILITPRVRRIIHLASPIWRVQTLAFPSLPHLRGRLPLFPSY